MLSSDNKQLDIDTTFDKVKRLIKEEKDININGN